MRLGYLGPAGTFSEEAGSGTLVVEVRDSMTNALLGRAIERRVAGDNGPWLRTSASNRADFDRQENDPRSQKLGL